MSIKSNPKILKSKTTVAAARIPMTVAPSGFPSFGEGTLEYRQLVSLDAGAGSLTYNTFNLNSLYDPDQTGTGHQPCGYDSWAALYSRYLVMSADVEVQFFASSGATTVMLAGLNAYTGSVPYNTSANTQAEQGGPVLALTGVRVNNSNCRNNLKYHFDPRKMFGIKDLMDAQNDVGALTNASPTRRGYLQIWLGPADESTDASAWYAEVHIRYHVRFFDPLQVGSS